MHFKKSGSKETEHLQELLRKGDATVGVVGLGYVGLPLCNAFQRAGVRVVGVDIDAEKVNKLDRGESYLKYTDEQMVSRLAASSTFRATIDFSTLSDADAIFICVPTPLGKHREPNLTYVESTSVSIGEVLRAGQLVVLESTTYPGTTREIVLPALEQASGLVHNVDFFVAYSPEREDPGRKEHTTSSTPKLVGGLTDQATRLAESIYKRAVDEVHTVSSAEVAEASKILENTFRAVNIALVNEMKVLFVEMGLDIFKVVRAASTKPFGFMPFYPGPGLGGHCIPIDPFYLTWKAREFGVQTKFVELAGEVNSAMPRYVVERVGIALNDQNQCVKGSEILLLGLAYKKDVDDVRESPAFEIARVLQGLGAVLSFSDPYVRDGVRERSPSINIAKVELTPANVRGFDIVVLLTDHTNFPYEMIKDEAKLILDTRGVYSEIDSAKIYQA